MAVAGSFAAEHRRLRVLRPDQPAEAIVQEAVRDFEAGDVYLVDPLGNLMMRFSKGTGMQGIRKDRKKLLRMSRIG